MSVLESESCTAFESFQLIAQGKPREVRAELKQLRTQRALGPVMVFDDASGEDFDLEGDNRFDVDTASASPETPRGPGRPKLGVIAREVTLLPRHWEWLESQSGGASVALRKLVEAARKEQAPEERIRQSIETTYRFMRVMCGNLPGFEEASRALFRRNWEDFDLLIAQMPSDVQSHLKVLSADARWENQGHKPGYLATLKLR
jgi:hypothetical protein